MGRKLYDWYYLLKVTEDQMDSAFSEVRGYSEDFIADHLTPGFSAIPSLTQHSPTPNFTVDVNIPGSGGIVGYDKIGKRIGIPTTQNVVLGTVSGGPVTLPSAGNEKYVTLFAGYKQFESDPQLDGNNISVNFQHEDGWEFTVIQGAQALAGSAVKPAHPGDNRLFIGDILLNSASTSILNSMIDQSRMTRLNLNDEIQGFDAKEMGINAGAKGVPTAGDDSTYWFYRGDKIAGGIRILEGADPNNDPPVIQVTRFTDSDTYAWSTISLGQVIGLFETVDANVIQGLVEFGAGSNVAITRVGNKFTFAASTGAAGWNDAGTYVETLDPNDSVKMGFAGAPDASAVLDVRYPSNTKGSLPAPRMTTAQKNAISSPAVGLLVYDTDLADYYYWDGSAWTNMGGGGGGGGSVEQKQVYRHVLTGTDITNKYFDLPFLPITGTVEAYPKTGNAFTKDDHFAVITNGVDIRRFTWDPAHPSVGEGVTWFVAGDIVTISYEKLGVASPAVLYRTEIEKFTLSGTDISNKYVDLANLPAVPGKVAVIVRGQAGQTIPEDAQIITNGFDLRRFSWNGLGLDGLLVIGSKMQVIYEYLA